MASIPNQSLAQGSDPAATAMQPLHREHLLAQGKHAPLLDLVIVGGGLSGLTVARQIHQYNSNNNHKPISWKLLEARSSFGGRIANDDTGDHVDLGGAWVWRGQRYMLGLISELGLKTFSQPDDGYSGSLRVVGGAAAVVNSMVESLSKDDVMTNAPVRGCVYVDGKDENGETDKDEPCVLVAYHDYNKDQNCPSDTQDKNENSVASLQFLRARKVVFAIPPQILAHRIQLLHSTPTKELDNNNYNHASSNLSPPKQRAIQASRTWMAGVTKVSLVYDNPRFWDVRTGMSNMGLPGHGPAFQVYDASEHNADTSDRGGGGKVALTFFTMVHSPTTTNDELASACANQLSKVWQHMGLPQTTAKKLHSYKRVHVQRWPMEYYISVEEFPGRVHPHPPVHEALADVEWEGRLHFAGTECDLENPGIMEGAVGAGLRVAAEVVRSLDK